jgi:hypothetical protein
MENAGAGSCSLDTGTQGSGATIGKTIYDYDFAATATYCIGCAVPLGGGKGFDCPGWNSTQEEREDEKERKDH